MIVSVVGIDPGETTGICFLDYHPRADGTCTPPVATVLQVSHKSAAHVLEGHLRAWYGDGERIIRRNAQVERFVNGRTAGAAGKPADVTRQLVMTLFECCQVHGYTTRLQNAVVAKDWATDKRLISAGIAKAPAPGTKGEIHGKLRDGFDAARHALYCAVFDAYMPDPLITRKAP